MAVKVGDIVRLKSGGPPMTVTWTGDDKAICHWFAGTDVKHETFRADALEPAEPEGGPVFG